MGEPRPVTSDDDASLVRASLAGDRAAFAAIYDRYADRLHDFCWSMLRNRDEAADVTQDTFLVAAERLPQLRDPERLHPWLYAIARSQVLRRFRARRRLQPAAAMEDLADPAEGPHRAAEQADLQALVWDAAAGLAERDRALLDLHLRQGLDGAELGEAMGVNANHAAVLLHRVRAQVERSIGALLVARLGSEDCDDLRQILTGWDGRFSPLLRKRVARHVDNCEVCDTRRRTVASPVALLSAVPMVGAPVDLRDRVLEQIELIGHQGPTNGSGEGGGEGGGPIPPRPSPPVAAMGAAAAALVLAVGTVIALPTVDGGAGEEPSGFPQPSAVVATPAEAQADPPSPSPSPSAPASAVETASPVPSVNEEASPSNVLPPASPAPEPPAPAPALLALSASTLDLGAGSSSATLGLRNEGGQQLNWTATAGDPWLTVEPPAGTLGADAQADLIVSVDRAALPEGTSEALVTVAGGGRQESLQVLVTQERPPEIGLPVLNPTSIGEAGCRMDSASISVTITDESGVASATARWSGAGSGAAPLVLRNGVWFGRVGPVQARGSVQVIVEAADTRGNRATSTAASLPVLPCVD